MTDSPAEKKPEAADKASANPAIPKARFDEVNGQKKDLADQLAEARRELEQLKTQKQSQPDADFVKTMAEVATSAVEAALEPIRKERDRYKTAAELGLSSDEQVAAVSGYVEKGLSKEEALMLARAKHKELFAEPAQPYDPRRAGYVPPGGFSAARTMDPAPKTDWRAKMGEELASATPDKRKVQQFAANAFAEQVLRMREQG